MLNCQPFEGLVTSSVWNGSEHNRSSRFFRGVAISNQDLSRKLVVILHQVSSAGYGGLGSPEVSLIVSLADKTNGPYTFCTVLCTFSLHFVVHETSKYCIFKDAFFFSYLFAFKKLFLILDSHKSQGVCFYVFQDKNAP